LLSIQTMFVYVFLLVCAIKHETMTVVVYYMYMY